MPFKVLFLCCKLDQARQSVSPQLSFIWTGSGGGALTAGLVLVMKKDQIADDVDVVCVLI